MAEREEGTYSCISTESARAHVLMRTNRRAYSRRGTEEEAGSIERRRFKERRQVGANRSAHARPSLFSLLLIPPFSPALYTARMCRRRAARLADKMKFILPPCPPPLPDKNTSHFYDFQIFFRFPCKISEKASSSLPLPLDKLPIYQRRRRSGQPGSFISLSRNWYSEPMFSIPSLVFSHDREECKGRVGSESRSTSFSTDFLPSPESIRADDR